jgi:hypothetical protein
MRFAGFHGPDAVQTVELMNAVRKGWAPLPGPPDPTARLISRDDPRLPSPGGRRPRFPSVREGWIDVVSRSGGSRRAAAPARSH